MKRFTRLFQGFLLLSLIMTDLYRPAYSEPEIIGWLEGAYLQPWGARVRAKMDSGAKTSSIHAEKIEVFELNGNEWVRFHFPFGQKDGYEHGFIIERPLVRQSRIKDHEKPSSTRYVIELDVCISGKTNTMQFSLADRSNFNYPMIIGREALGERYIIDPGSTFLGNRTCPRKFKKSTPVNDKRRGTNN